MVTPPQFSLKLLMIGMAVISAGLAIWRVSPDPNNTLPMRELLPTDLVRVLQDPRHSAEPVLLLIDEDQSLDARHAVFVNTTEKPITITGYTPQSYTHRPPPGNIGPLYRIDIDDGQGWMPEQIGWCGTGLGQVIIKPGHAGRFDFRVRAPEKPFRLSLGSVSGQTVAEVLQAAGGDSSQQAGQPTR